MQMNELIRYAPRSLKSPAMCKYCLKECSNILWYTFLSPANRLRHEKRHNDPRYELSCNICWKRHDTKEDLEMHMTRHEMKYSCAECGELVATKNQLRNHMSENHVSKEYIEKEKEMFIKDGLQEYTI
ncbi:hypothetical protein NQ317_001135 [Molorchus minor]|uniref:C2H2-type domain-containing protein n=1 Tax=Molorchus minor TaxID=1323400 RepID=A0ABQ9J8G3_9CUCU|nr:hypothetical protein NQ317_001135 [Molorchus minor]